MGGLTRFNPRSEGELGTERMVSENPVAGAGEIINETAGDQARKQFRASDTSSPEQDSRRPLIIPHQITQVIFQ
ncbi:hypothetical protein R5W23_001634 [Gemmata sp. JC673]|uniref:Uncharacterized protein n=1 Tax=Gemmata algarum TaxID=2975278 RepID=A0ABU5F0Y6_9BACT|nr:hypothetical protein [Gemmata algarum]MDY3560400.1 hypothetical protein [Gemmata algarum]